jgi:drug/metabolite transporter (DMT)-like permease
VGKAFVNAELGFLIAALIAWLFTKEAIEWWKIPIGIIVVLANVIIGAWLIQISHHVKKREDQNNG